MDNSIEDLNKAWDDAEEVEEKVATPEGEEDVSGDSAEVDESSDGDDGAELRSERGPDDKQPDPDAAEPVPGDTKKPEGDGVRDASDDSAPVSWNAKAREAWKKIPKEAREYIQQREHQMQVGLQKNAEGARRAQAMDQTLQPYQQYFAMNGGAGPTIQGLLQAGATLTMGSPAQRAQTVASIISQYGVDIATLDNLLVGKAPAPEVRQNEFVQQQIQKALAPYQQYMSQQQQMQQERQQQTQNQAGTEVQRFAADPKNEFYRDVRMDMADILDLAAKRGLEMSMKDAYHRACLMHPEISSVMQARQRGGALAKKKNVAVSIQGNRGGGGESASPESTRAALEAAWDNAGSI